MFTILMERVRLVADLLSVSFNYSIIKSISCHYVKRKKKL
jgi:hypothetical protein